MSNSRVVNDPKQFSFFYWALCPDVPFAQEAKQVDEVAQKTLPRTCLDEREYSVHGLLTIAKMHKQLYYATEQHRRQDAKVRAHLAHFADYCNLPWLVNPEEICHAKFLSSLSACDFPLFSQTFGDNIGCAQIEGAEKKMGDRLGYLRCNFPLAKKGRSLMSNIVAVIDGETEWEVTLFIRDNFLPLMRKNLDTFIKKKICDEELICKVFINTIRDLDEATVKMRGSANLLLLLENETGLYTFNVGICKALLVGENSILQLTEDALVSEKRFFRTLSKGGGGVICKERKWRAGKVNEENGRLDEEFGLFPYARAIGLGSPFSARPKITFISREILSGHTHLIAASSGLFGEMEDPAFSSAKEGYCLPTTTLGCFVQMLASKRKKPEAIAADILKMVLAKQKKKEDLSCVVWKL